MDHDHVDSLAPTVVPSRRSALAALVAAISGVAGVVSGEARSRKKKGQDCGKKERQRCSADVATCRTLLLANCADEGGACETLATCCDACSADGLLTCLIQLQNAMA
jgi:hypothetical protein